MTFVFDSETGTINEHGEDIEVQVTVRKVKRVVITPQGQKEPFSFEVGPSTLSVLSVLLSLPKKRWTYKFHLTDEDKQMIRDCFEEELVDDALNNPETKYTAIKALLSEEPVLVILIRA